MKIQVTHVKFEGDNESIREVLRSLPQLFGGYAVEQPALAELEPLQALPAPVASPVIQNPVVARKLTQRRTRAIAPTSAAPATAPTLKAAAVNKASRAPAGERTNAVLLICREKAGQFTLDQAAALAGVKKQQVHNGLWYAKNKGNEWACVGEFQFKRAASSEQSAKHPDLDGTSMPINPDRIQSVEKVTPAHIAAR